MFEKLCAIHIFNVSKKKSIKRILKVLTVDYENECYNIVRLSNTEYIVYVYLNLNLC